MLILLHVFTVALAFILMPMHVNRVLMAAPYVIVQCNVRYALKVIIMIVLPAQDVYFHAGFVNLLRSVLNARLVTMLIVLKLVFYVMKPSQIVLNVLQRLIA